LPPDYEIQKFDVKTGKKFVRAGACLKALDLLAGFRYGLQCPDHRWLSGRRADGDQW